ncbi:MAG: DUF977 family protein [Gammaproteobacteria bacterium]|nr:DUF977 family protein [Gammaproteobacteria bacterium]
MTKELAWMRYWWSKYKTRLSGIVIGYLPLYLKKQKGNLAIKVEKEKTASDSSLPLLSIQVLKLLGEHERLTIAQMVEFTGANQNTLKVRLRELVNDGRIKRHGKARATWYSL